MRLTARPANRKKLGGRAGARGEVQWSSNLSGTTRQEPRPHYKRNARVLKCLLPLVSKMFSQDKSCWRLPPGNLWRCTSAEFMGFLIKSPYVFSNNLFLKLKCQLSQDLSSLLPPGSLPPSVLPSLLSFLPSIRPSIICHLSKHPPFPLKYQCLPKHSTGHWNTKVSKTVLLSQIL